MNREAIARIVREVVRKIGLPVVGLVTHRYPLSRIQEAFDISLRQEGIKVVVRSTG